MRVTELLVSLFVAASALGAQAGAVKTEEQISKAQAAHEKEFDYLLGDWDFTATNRNGSFRGRWSAARLPETGQIVDEFRVLNDSGRTVVVSTTVRAYNAILDRWELVSVDSRGTGLGNRGTAHRDGAEMRVEQTFGAGTPTSWTSRIRYYDITPESFRWRSDRSNDGGKTWLLGYQDIDARRVGPPRVLAPLTRP